MPDRPSLNPWHSDLIDRGRVERARDDCVRNIDEAKVMVSRMGAQRRERVFHRQTSPLGNHAFRLFDHDSAIQRKVELFIDVSSLK